MSCDQATLSAESLVLYKVRPARVRALGEKIEIELEGGQTKRVRPKDIELLHPGPLRRLDDLTLCAGDLDEAWELLDGVATDLKELAELLHGEYSPATAWAAWQTVMDGLYFVGTPAAIVPRARAEIERLRAERAVKAQAERDWAAFLARVERSAMSAEDTPRLAEVERLAWQETEHCRLLHALGLPETPASAHRFLLKVGHWTARDNPYPRRCGIALTEPALPVPALPEEERLDLTHLPAFAIDDEGNRDPDDALSLDDEGRLWVHIADVAALVTPDDPLDRAARAHGANLYLPEGTVNMLPGDVTACLGLGLRDISPALSIGMHVGPNGAPTDIAIRPSWVRVTRLTYAEVEGQLDAAPFAAFRARTERFRAHRQAQGAIDLELPEVTVRVEDGAVRIRPLEHPNARALVADAMLMAGTAVAHWCQAAGIPIPYVVQPAPECRERPATLAAMHACRRQFKPSRLQTEPGAHCGLGLPLYTRATSPLRRYADLVVHQQLRAAWRETALLTAQQIDERMGPAELAGGAARRAERQSNLHWKLVYLQERPDWRGEATVVEIEERRTIALVPTLALEVRLRTKRDWTLDQRVRVAIEAVDLPELECSFRVRD